MERVHSSQSIQVMVVTKNKGPLHVDHIQSYFSDSRRLGVSPDGEIAARPYMDREDIYTVTYPSHLGKKRMMEFDMIVIYGVKHVQFLGTLLVTDGLTPCSCIRSASISAWQLIILRVRGYSFYDKHCFIWMILHLTTTSLLEWGLNCLCLSSSLHDGSAPWTILY